MLQASCKDFLNRLASGDPTPGGGGASAFCAALAAALAGMVANLTSGKKKYAEYQDDIERILADAERLRLEFEDLVNADAEVFTPLAKAYGLPKNTPEEIEYRQQVMEKCLKDASAVPLQIMENVTQTIVLLEELTGKGSRLAISDVGVGAEFCRSALIGASFNVFINTDLLKDREYAAQLNAKVDALLDEWTKRADKVVDDVTYAIRK